MDCLSREDLKRNGVKVNSVNPVFSNVKKIHGKPATKKKKSAIRPKLNMFIFWSLVNEVFFNQNPTK